MLALAGCIFDPETPNVEIDIRPWYPSQEILIPFRAGGDGVAYAEYRYEYNAGNGWVVDIDRMIRIPANDHGLIELTAADPSWDHRLIFSALGQPGPGQPLEPITTTERYFHIDTTPPSAESGSLQLVPYEDGASLGDPPYTYEATLRLEVLVDHPEFLAPWGSFIRVYYTRDGSAPNERSEGLDRKGFVEVWPDGGSATANEVLRFIVIDLAGNRSGVRTMVFSAP